MTSKFKIITSGIFFTIITIFIYLMLRIDIIENDFIKSVTGISNNISGTYKKFIDDNKKYNTSDLANLINNLNTNNPTMALLAVTDMNYTLKLASKNDRFIKSGDLYNTIMDHITNRKLADQGNRPYITRYYEIKIDKNSEEQKYYIFNKIINNDRLLIFFPYHPRNKIIIKICLEIALIILFFVIITTAIYLISEKKNSREIIVESINLNDEAVSTRIDLNSESKSLETENNKISGTMSNLASDTLNTYVLDLFTKLKNNYAIEILSLYLKINDITLAKRFELKGNSFIKSDASSFDTIDLNSSIGGELKKSSIIFLNNNKKVIIPAVHDESLIGILSLIKNDQFTGDEINKIKIELSGITGQLSDYLVVNRVMIDTGTGNYSKAYFQLKYNEQIKMHETDNKFFSVLFISLFDKGININIKDWNSIIKILSPAIAKLLNNESYICIYDIYLGIILPGINRSEATEISANIFKTLSKYRIKIDKNLILNISPNIGIGSSDTEKRDDLINAAIKNMR